MMRFYSLTPPFTFSKHNFKSITPQTDFKERALYDQARVIRTQIVKERCFVTLNVGLRTRQSQIIVDGLTITNLHITNRVVILIGEQQFVGWMSLKNLLDQFNHSQFNKIILTPQQFHKLPFYSRQIHIIQSKSDLLFIFFKLRTISLFKYNEAMESQSQVLLKMQSQIIRSITVDSHYHNSQNILFIVQSDRNIFVCELNALNKVSFDAIVQRQGEQQGQLQLGIVNDRMMVLLYNSLIYLVENKEGSWYILGRLVPQADVISLHTYQNSIITHQVSDNIYSVFRYCVDDICSFTKLVPYTLYSSKEYKPLCLIKTNQLAIWLRGDQSFLLMKPIFKLTTLFNGSYQNLFNPQMVTSKILADQLQKMFQTLPCFRSNFQALSSLGIDNKWSFLQQFVSQYLSIFICLAAYTSPHILLPQKLILPFHLQRAVSDTKVICTQKPYSLTSLQRVKGLNGKIELISKKAYTMSVIVKLASSQKQHIFNKLSLNQMISLLFDTNGLVQFLVVGLRREYTNNNKESYLKYRSLLTSITQYDKDHSPYIYLITNQPFEFTYRYFRESINNNKQMDEQDELQEYLHKYHASSYSQDLLLNSISRDHSFAQEQQKQMIHESAFEMAFSMQEKDQLYLSDLDLGPLYDYCCRLKLLNNRVIKIILLQYQEWQFRSSHNQSVSQHNSKNLNQQNYKCIKKRLIVQENNLIDNLIQNYLLNLQQLSIQFNLKFTGRLFQKKKQIQFDNLLQEKRINISIIQNAEEPFHEKQFQISCCSQQQPFKYYLNKSLWDMYLSLTNIQQYHFEVYQHITGTHFVQSLIDAHHSNSQSVDKPVKISKKDGRRFLQELNQERKKFRISLRKIEGERAMHFWMKLIQLCCNNKRRWLGDPFDLLQQILQKWYIFTHNECNKVMESIYELFFIGYVGDG